jgi:hypothetical protein
MANTLAGNNNVNSYIGTQSKIKNLSPIAEIDRVNVYEFENGMDVELTNLGGELTSENIRKAQSKVLKNLKKDPAFYTNQIAEETIKRFGEYGSGKRKQGKYVNKKDAESVKADGGKAKVKPTDAPFGKNEEVKGKYKSSGMSPLKEAYSISNQTTSTDPGEYEYGKMHDLGEIDVDSDKAVKDAMTKHVSTPVKSWDSIVKDLAKDGKVKLTKENADAIQKMVSEAVAMVTSKGGTAAVDYNNPQELDALRRDSNVSSIKTTTGQKLK